MSRVPRVTIHDLTTLERRFLTALFARAGGVADREFAVAGTMAAAVRGLHALSVVSITDAGLVIELEDPHAQ